MNKCRNMQYFFFSTIFQTMVHCPSDETVICTIYNMSGRVVSDIRYNTDANVVNDLKNYSSYEFIGEVILKINVV